MMRWFPAGSAAWLLAHEVRLGWRGMSGPNAEGKKTSPSTGQAFLIALAVFGVGVLVLGGIGLGFVVSRWPLPQTPMVVAIAAGATALLFTLMLSSAINLSVQALYDRRDLDLLLSSPLEPRTVLTVRAVSIAVLSALMFVGIATPFVVTASVLGAPEWLGLFVVLIGLGMIATALGIVLTMALFAMIGPRATRTAGQIIGGVVGALVFLASQLWNLTRGTDDDDSAGPLNATAVQLVESGWFQPDGPLALPLRAVSGDALAILLFAGIAVAGFLAVTIGLAPRFSANVTEAAGTKASVQKGADRPFAAGLTRVMVRKELRLLARDPQLISQILLRLLYLLPLGFVLFRDASSNLAIALTGGAVVIMTGQLASSFAWIAVSAEDSPDLLRSAPIDRAAADRAKLIAALIPTLSLTALVLAGVAVLSPLAALVVLVGALCSALSSGWIQVWQQKPATRKAFNQNRKGSILVGLAEFIVQAFWAGATGIAVTGSLWALVPAAVAVGITLALRRPSERRYPQNSASLAGN